MEGVTVEEKIVKYLLNITRWGKRISPFLKENGYHSNQSEDEEKKSLRSLHDSDTAIMALLVGHRHYAKLYPFTVSSLAKAMDNSSFDARKAMERKVRRKIESIAGYGIIDFERSQQGDRPCILIQPTDLLLDFFENHFFD